MEEDKSFNLGWSIVKWTVFFLILGLIFNQFRDDPEFEGRKAKDWYYLYVNERVKHQEFRSCVEPYARSDDYDDLKEIYQMCF